MTDTPETAPGSTRTDPYMSIRPRTDSMTSWWWIRHAPVRNHGGRIYGALDAICDTSDTETYSGLARLLPPAAVWVTSHLSRTKDTMMAIGGGGYALPPAQEEHDLGEQSFGDWHGKTHDEIKREQPADHRGFWIAPATARPPNGESFADLAHRVHAVVKRMTAAHGGRDIVAVAHGGTIRAALGLALALPPEQMLAFRIDNLSVTRIDHFPLDSDPNGAWRVTMVNASPYLGAIPVGRGGNSA